MMKPWNGQALGEKQLEVERLVARSREEFKRRAPVIRARYPEGAGISDYTVYRIIRNEERLKICAKCGGLPCKLRDNQCLVEVFQYDADYNGVITYLDECVYKRQARRQRKIEKLFSASKIPSQYIGKSFSDYEVDLENERAVKAARVVIENPSQGVYIYGGFGTGKTMLASIIAQEVMKKQRAVLFTTVPELSSSIRASYKAKSEMDETQIYDALYKIPTLILDDLGTDKPTKFVAEMLGKIINNRYNERRQTIITSNYSLKEVEQIYNNPVDGEKTYDGSRIVDRCKENCQPVQISGGSRRGIRR